MSRQIEIISVVVIKSPQTFSYGEEIRYSKDPVKWVTPQMDGTDGILSFCKITMLLPSLKIHCSINVEWNYRTPSVSSEYIPNNPRERIINYIQNNIAVLTEESINEDLIYFILE